jgi:sulfur relay protein TusB/DsrH
MGDGVYAAFENTQACQQLQATHAEIFLLAADAHLAGVSITESPFHSITMEELVALTERFVRQLAWY